MKGVMKRMMPLSRKTICFSPIEVAVGVLVMVLIVWLIVSLTAPTVSSCKAFYTTVNTEAPLWSKEGYEDGGDEKQPLGSATVGGCAGSSGTGSCASCASNGSYEWSPCKCFGIQGAAINAPRPLKTSSCSSQTGMSKKQMVESQVGCLRNSFAFPAEGCGISGVS